MKTIAFHSYKGGVGRTLALANLGIALGRLGKRVVMLDLDLDAPGLPSKFGLESVPGGYLDYLYSISHTREENRPDRFRHPLWLGIEQHVHELRERVVDPEGGLKLIPAGNTIDGRYWGHLASQWLHHLFYFSPAQLLAEWDGHPAAVDPTANLEFFRQQIHVFATIFDQGTEYLLIDCKGGATEVTAIALQLWADVLVSLFPNNPEGFQGAALTQQAVLATRTDAPPVIVPVLCETPWRELSDPDTPRAAAAEFRSQWTKLSENQGPAFPATPLSVLHDYRQLRYRERLVLAEKGDQGDLDVPLAHDYLALFEVILGEDPGVRSTLAERGGRSWKSLLGMPEDIQETERRFRLHGSDLINVDRRRNIALRVESLQRILEQIYADLVAATPSDSPEHSQAAAQGLWRCGFAAGENFGREMMEMDSLWSAGPPEDYQARLDRWCEFDSAAGFGNIKAQVDPKTLRGKVVIENGFLATGDDPANTDVRQFLVGYLAGVISRLLAAGETPFEVTEAGPQDYYFRPKLLVSTTE